MQILQQMSEFLQEGNESKVFELTELAIRQDIPPKDILDKGLISGMNVVGEKFREHEIFLPEVLMAAKAMYAGMNQLKPLLIEEGIPSQGKVVLGTVQGDLHDIGKNLVSIMLQGAGYEVIDLGKGVSPEKFIEAADAENASVIGMSALLTTTMPTMKKVIDLLKEKKLSGTIKTIIGGAPVSAGYARHIGADAYAYDAASAIIKIKELVEL